MSNTTFSGPVRSINGLVFPVVTTTQMNAISSPAAGLTVYNSTVGAIYTYTGTAWVNSQAAPVPAPTVISISPPTGTEAGGTSVVITGTGFTGATSVTIGGTAVTSFTVDNSTQISAVTAARTAGSGLSVLVTTPGGTNAANSLFTYTSAVIFPFVLTDAGTNTMPEFTQSGPSTLFNPSGTQWLNYSVFTTSIFVRTLSTPFDVTSVVSSSTKSSNIGSGIIIGAFFNGNGSSLYVLVQSGGNVDFYMYNLSVNYDLTTLSYFTGPNTFYSGMGSTPRSVNITPDGTKLIFAKINTFDTIIDVITLPTPYDPSSYAGAPGTNFNASSLVEAVAGFNARIFGSAFDSTGKVFFFNTTSGSNDNIYQFLLGTAYDVSTTSSNNTTSISLPSGAYTTAANGLTVANANTRLVSGYDFAGGSGVKYVQYTLSP